MSEHSTEMVKTASNTPAVKSHEQAMDLVKKAEKLLDSVRPEEKSIRSFPENSFFDVALPVTSLVLSIAGLITVGGGLIFSSGMTAISGGAVAIASTTSFFLSLQAGSSHYSTKQGLFQKFLDKVFLSKEQEEWTQEYREIQKDYETSLEMYQLLVDKTAKELESKGVFATLNNLEDPENNVFVHFNEKEGYFHIVNREKYEAFERNKLVNNHDLLQKVIMQKVVEEELFS